MRTKSPVSPFVAAVSELAREVRQEAEDGEATADWGTYPIVMDAAFGSLDENYQKEVSRASPPWLRSWSYLFRRARTHGNAISELSPTYVTLGIAVTHTSNVEHDWRLSSSKVGEYPYIQTREEANRSELEDGQIMQTQEVRVRRPQRHEASSSSCETTAFLHDEGTCSSSLPPLARRRAPRSV